MCLSVRLSGSKFSRGLYLHLSGSLWLSLTLSDLSEPLNTSSCYLLQKLFLESKLHCQGFYRISKLVEDLILYIIISVCCKLIHNACSVSDPETFSWHFNSLSEPGIRSCTILGKGFTILSVTLVVFLISRRHTSH